MEKTNETLSELNHINEFGGKCFHGSDVKSSIQRFIKELKEKLCLDEGLGICDTALDSNFNNKCNTCKIIDKKALEVFGEKLV